MTACEDLTAAIGYDGPLGDLLRPGREVDLQVALDERHRRLVEWLAITYGYRDADARCLHPRHAPYYPAGCEPGHGICDFPHVDDSSMPPTEHGTPDRR